MKMTKFIFVVLAVAIVCVGIVQAGKKGNKSKWGPGKDLELCLEFCEDKYLRCMADTDKCPLLTSKGDTAKLLCEADKARCHKSCQETFPSGR
ncbi:hypothetical protein LSAT2_001327 [Lamellibrachia satsuma]|nr:hypothetical protein LSAT2_001327 [Lamellibrachia satsuma]